VRRRAPRSLSRLNCVNLGVKRLPAGPQLLRKLCNDPSSENLPHLAISSKPFYIDNQGWSRPQPSSPLFVHRPKTFAIMTVRRGRSCVKLPWAPKRRLHERQNSDPGDPTLSRDYLNIEHVQGRGRGEANDARRASSHINRPRHHGFAIVL
jgi:hypothetical protein